MCNAVHSKLIRVIKMKYNKINRWPLINTVIAFITFIFTIIFIIYVNHYISLSQIFFIFLAFLAVAFPSIFLTFYGKNFNKKWKVLFYIHFIVLLMISSFLSLVFFLIPLFIEIYYITADKYRDVNYDNIIKLNNIIEIARSEIKNKFNVNDVVIESQDLEEDKWIIITKFTFNDEKKYYKIIIDNEKESVESLSEYNYSIPDKLTIRNESIIILIAFIISIIYLVYKIYTIIVTANLISTSKLAPAISIFSGVYELIYLTSFIMLVDIYIILRIFMVLIYLNSGNYKQVYKENSVVLGILALIFGGIVPGILLLIVRDKLNEKITNN